MDADTVEALRLLRTAYLVESSEFEGAYNDDGTPMMREWMVQARALLQRHGLAP